MQFDWSVIWFVILFLIEGVKMILWILVFGLVGGLVIGLLVGFVCIFGGWIVNYVVLVFIEVICGIFIVVQVMFIYFVLLMVFNDLCIDLFIVVVVIIMINFGVYIVEIMCGVVLFIYKGFCEVGLVFGFLCWEIICYVILLLVLCCMLLLLGNQWIISIKDILLFIVIGVVELICQG